MIAENIKIITFSEIKKIIEKIDLFETIEKGFIAYSKHQTVIPPVGELLFDHPPGDVHIKYGYIKQDDFYVIKVASSFYDNPQLNLPSSQGLMLLFDRKTGRLLSILLDEGYLTNVRTAIAGTITANYLAPKKINCIGIVGTGIQAKMQLSYLQHIAQCKNVIVWGRTEKTLQQYKNAFSNTSFNIDITQTIEDVTEQANLIITTTPSKIPLITKAMVRPGTHITAIGSDTPDKQELDEAIFSIADRVVSDSISQSQSRGEIYKAINKGILKASQIVELGDMLLNSALQRQNEDQITIADLTGLAVQDIQVAKAVYTLITCHDPKR